MKHSLAITVLLSCFLSACAMHYKGKDLISHHNKMIKQTTHFSKKVEEQLSKVDLEQIKTKINKSSNLDEAKKLELISELEKSLILCKQSNDKMAELRLKYDNDFKDLNIVKKKKYNLSSNEYKIYKANKKPGLKAIKIQAGSVRRECGRINVVFKEIER